MPPKKSQAKSAKHEPSQKAKNNDSKEKKEIEESSSSKIRKETAEKPKIDFLAQLMDTINAHLGANHGILGMALQNIKNEDKYIIPANQLNAASICYSSLKSGFDRDELIENPSQNLIFDPILLAFEDRNSPNSMLSFFMGGFKIAFKSFQQIMRDDSNKCYHNVAMYTLENIIEIASRRLNEKGQRSRVHVKSCPKIFEEACREADIKVKRLTYSKSDDLLAYELYFPTNCRMVIAIPVNNPEAMGKSNKNRQ